MPVVSKTIELNTKGNCDIIDITDEVLACLDGIDINDGILVVFVVGSTGALTTIEYEPGLLFDFNKICQKLIPDGEEYRHDLAWKDGNGHSHLRASLLGPSLTVPFNNKKMVLGTWQQIVFVDFDNRKRERKLVVQIIGE